MKKNKKSVLILLILLNCIVLLGQIWPQGAPPFAGAVNVATLILNLILFTIFLIKKRN